MIARKIEPQLRTLTTMYPVVTITGPRQSGKTTLARMVFPEYKYVSLENFDRREAARTDPKGFLDTFPPPVIFDEIQRVPELLSYIQTRVDEDRRPGQYVLTGSHQPMLGESVSQSLAGRTGILRLLPLSIAELASAGISPTRDEYLHQGFMPRLYDTALDAKNLYREEPLPRLLRHLCREGRAASAQHQGSASLRNLREDAGGARRSTDQSVVAGGRCRGFGADGFAVAFGAGSEFHRFPVAVLF